MPGDPPVLLAAITLPWLLSPLGLSSACLSSSLVFVSKFLLGVFFPVFFVSLLFCISDSVSLVPTLYLCLHLGVVFLFSFLLALSVCWPLFRVCVCVSV